METVTLPTLEEIKKAQKRLEKITIHTPLVRYNETSDIYLKPETLQPVKSFKLRGVYNATAILTEKQREKGLLTVSSGNTAIALGWTAKHFGVSAKTFVPETTPKSKLKIIKSFGVEIIKKTTEEIVDFVLEKGWEKESANFIHPLHNKYMQAGNGTIGLEIIEDLAEVNSVYLPVGGGGLIAGVGNALKLLNSDIRVIGVESEACASLHASFEAGKGVEVSFSDTICDGSNVPFITEELFPSLRKVVDVSVTVTEKAVKKTMKDLMINHKLIVEGSGALATTAALQEPIENRGKSVCVISGGTIDTEKIIAILTDSNL